MASPFISRAQDCLLINAFERGASDPDDSQGSSVEDAHVVGVSSREKDHQLGLIFVVLGIIPTVILTFPHQIDCRQRCSE